MVTAAHSLETFRCVPYNATLTRKTCAANYNMREFTRKTCKGCPIGAAHAEGRTPTVEAAKTAEVPKVEPKPNATQYPPTGLAVQRLTSRTCKSCNDPYRGYGNSRYCAKCKAARTKTPHPNRTCKMCGEGFASKYAKLHCPKCQELRNAPGFHAAQSVLDEIAQKENAMAIGPGPEATINTKSALPPFQRTSMEENGVDSPGFKAAKAVLEEVEMKRLSEKRERLLNAAKRVQEARALLQAAEEAFDQALEEVKRG